MNNNENLNQGCILISRSILNSEIWKKPPEYLKIFLYILLKVNHKKKLYPRGSNFFNFTEQKIDGVTRSQIYNFIRWAKSDKVAILTTQKTTRGVILKVNNYDEYQTINNYYLQNTLQNSYKTATKQLQNSYKTINKNERMKECKNVRIINKKIPTKKEIEDFSFSLGKSIDIDSFIAYWNATDWLDKNGLPVIWKQKVISWANRTKQNHSTDCTNNSLSEMTKEKKDKVFADLRAYVEEKNRK